MSPVNGSSFYLFVFIFFWALMVFAFKIRNKFLLLRKAQPIDRFDQPWERIKRVIKYVIGQNRILKDKSGGLMHAFIFWGFSVLLLRTIIVFSWAFSEKFFEPFLNSTIGKLYSFVKDFFVLAVIIAVIYAIIRRAIIKPRRLESSFEAYLVLFFILTLMVTDILMDSALFGIKGSGEGFLGNLFYPILKGNTSYLTSLFKTAWWIHVITLLTFLNLLPGSKHFHVITSIFNVYFQPLEGMGRIHRIEDIENAEKFGKSEITDLNWKQVLDLYSCTECGRCHEFCPATYTDKPLSPKRMNDVLKHYLYDHEDEILNGKKVDDLFSAGVLNEDAIWDCTNCGFCESRCPLFIEQINRILDFRRYLVLEESRFPEEVIQMYKGLETKNNPWNQSPADRFKWAEGLEVKTLAEDYYVEYLLWVGCACSYDEKSKKIASAVVKLLNKGGVSFGVLGDEEGCCGDPARRTGNEYLFEMMVEANLEILNQYKVKKIITICPHGYNIFKNEYPEFGANFEVYHYTEILADLLEKGKLKPVKRGNGEKVTFHDPCFLGRHNDIFDEPRKVIESIAGIEFVEPSLTREKSFCCGGGGGRMFMEENRGTRINHKRIDNLMEVNPDKIITSCPYCKTMISDGLNEKSIENVKNLDLAEFLLESLEENGE